MKLLAGILKLLGAIMRLFPLKQRVAFLSRQSATVSLDYKLLITELRKTLPTSAIEICVSASELESKPRFALNTLRQLRLASTSAVVVADGYIPAVSIPKKRTDVTVFQMWHALGAVKKFGYQCLDTPAGRTSAQAEVARMHKNYDWIIAGGPWATEALAAAFGYSTERVLPLGLPRIDYLQDASPQGERLLRAAQITRANPWLENGHENVLYCPTLRKGPGYENWLSTYVEELAKRYKTQPVNLVVSAHPLSGNIASEVFDRFPFVHKVTHAATIDLLEFANVVVSDYSAVIYEALVLGKQVEVFAPDIEQYRQSPGLNVEPEHISAAEIAAGVPAAPTHAIAQAVLEALGRNA